MKSSMLLLFLFFITMAKAQQFGPANNEQSLKEAFWESIQTQGTALDSLMVWQEQVLLHTDKDVLTPKDHLFFKAYVLTGPKQLRVSASDVLKIELLDEDGNLVDSQYHKILNGSAEGSLMIPREAKSGKHYVRAYTRWMLNYGPENFATEEISIRDKRNNTMTTEMTTEGVGIYPEGGQIIAGLQNRVAVSIKNHNSTQMKVVDGNGGIVANVKDYGNGLGTFLFTPEDGKKYYLKLGAGKRVTLPDAGDVGYTIQLNTIGSENIVAKIAATDNVKKQDVFLRGRVNGISLFESKIKFEGANTIEVDIPKYNLPNGMIQLQVEDEFDQVWATRPLHVDNKQLKFQVEKSTVSNSDVLKIRVTDSKGTPIQTELSIALSADKANTEKSSDFETPRNQRFVNDLLVLTDRLPKEYALNRITELPTEIKYNFQEGLEFYGRAYDLDAVPLPNTKLQIVISGQEDAMAYEVMTNEEGLFKLSGLQINGEADMVFRRAGENQRDQFVKVIPYEYETPPLIIENATKSAGLNSKQFIPKKQVADFMEGEDGDKLITLEGVTLVGEKFKVKKTPSVYNIQPTHTVVQDPKKPKFVSELFMNIPGVFVTGSRDYPGLNILNRGGTTSSSGGGPIDSPGPLWIIDGVNVGNSPGFDPEWGLTHIDIDRIEFLIRSAEASLWGSRANQGVILVYTRNGSDENYFNRKKAQLTFEGYHDSLSFDAYREEFTGKKSKIDSNVFYWNPALETDEKGEAIIQLPIDAEKEILQVDVKAITLDGKNGSLKTILQ